MIPAGTLINIGKQIFTKGGKFLKAPNRIAELTNRGYDIETAKKIAYFEIGTAATLLFLSEKEISPLALEIGFTPGFEAGFAIGGPGESFIGGVIGYGLASLTMNYIAWNLFYELSQKFAEELFIDGIPDDNTEIDLPQIPTTISYSGPRYEALKLFNQAQNTDPIPVDPILIDLNGDGIKTTTIENGTYFDHESDGFAEKSAWVDENDGILAIDKNNDGIINDGSEIFGDSYINKDGTKATSGLNALKDLDLNNDGVINSSDTEFQNIKILKGDGSLISLEEAGIVSINLNSTSSNTTDENGNTVVSTGTFTKADGTIGDLGDYNLQVDKFNSVATEWLDETDDVKELPEVMGTGEMYSFHQAIMRDETGELKELIESYLEEENPTNRRNMINNIIYKWAGVEVRRLGLDPTKLKTCM